MSALSYLFDTHQTLLLGHRGARGEYLENSYAGFVYIQQLIKSRNSRLHTDKLAGIEFDVQLTFDGKLVVFHDPDLLRLFSCQSRVDQLSAAELQRISQHNSAQSQIPSPILLLEQMPDLLLGYTHIELEIKTHNHTSHAKLITALKHCLSDPKFKQLPITLTSFDTNLLQKIKETTELKHLKRGLLVEPACSTLTNKLLKTTALNHNFPMNTEVLMSTGGPLSKVVDTALRLGCSSLGIFYPLFNSKLINECQQYGLSTTAWTVNNLESAKHLSRLGVNYLITDYPSVFLAK